MKEDNNFLYLLKHFNLKHRLSLRNEHDQQEVWYMHISPMNLLGGVLALILLLFIIILTTVAYTPVLDLIPGYPGNKSREMLIHSTMRLDSLERELTSMQLYTQNISLIMEGRTPVVRSVAESDSLKAGNIATVRRNYADSLLRIQIEGEGIYSLGTTVAPQVNSSSALTIPVKGVVASHFDPRQGIFGVRLATASSQQVVAVREGTIIMSIWSPDYGHIVEVQHSSNMLSVYKRLASTLQPVGTRVKAGEVIGTTSSGASTEQGKGLFEFELWIDGTAVDPQIHMVL